MKVIYVSGPVRAKTEWGFYQNARRAEDAALQLWAKGWVVICPHKNTERFTGYLPDQVWLDGDLVLVERSDAICMINGWERSEGANMEYARAIEQGITIYFGEENVPNMRGT